MVADPGGDPPARRLDSRRAGAHGLTRLRARPRAVVPPPVASGAPDRPLSAGAAAPLSPAAGPARGLRRVGRRRLPGPAGPGRGGRLRRHGRSRRPWAAAGLARRPEVVAAAAAGLGARFADRAVTVPAGARPRGAGPGRPLRRPAGGGADRPHRGRPGRDRLLNLLRGAGLDGLGGMRPAPAGRAPAPRPAAGGDAGPVAALGLAPVCDPSNADPRFRRNRVRHELLPLADIAGRDPVPCWPARRACWPAKVSCSTPCRLAGSTRTDTAALRPRPVGARWPSGRYGLAARGHGARERHPPSTAEPSTAPGGGPEGVAGTELAGGRRSAAPAAGSDVARAARRAGVDVMAE